MKKSIRIFLIIFTVILIIVVWRLAMPSGYYATPEIALEREKKSIDSQEIASFYNGEGLMKVLQNGSEIVFYDFVPRKTLTGIKYGAVQACKLYVDYDKITDVCPDINNWYNIQLFRKIDREREMKNVKFTFVENSNDFEIESDVMRFTYKYNNQEYVLLCKLIEQK